MVYLFRNCCKFITNSVDPNQTPPNVASDLGLPCLPLFFL